VATITPNRRLTSAPRATGVECHGRIQQFARIELAINTNTAKALGLSCRKRISCAPMRRSSF
jgi:hypothetical protein